MTVQLKLHYFTLNVKNVITFCSKVTVKTICYLLCYITQIILVVVCSMERMETRLSLI